MEFKRLGENSLRSYLSQRIIDITTNIWGYEEYKEMKHARGVSVLQNWICLLPREKGPQDSLHSDARNKREIASKVILNVGDSQ